MTLCAAHLCMVLCHWLFLVVTGPEYVGQTARVDVDKEVLAVLEEAKEAIVESD